MALTKAQGKFSQAIDDGADATAITIDSSENVGIGTNNPSVALDISQANARLKVQDGTNQLNIGLWDGANYRVEGDANRKILITSYHSDGIHLGNSGASDLVIKGNNVFVGTTDTTLYNNSGSGNGGIALSMPAAGAGRIDVARDGNNMTLNRLDSDGEMVEFYRSGGACGKIHARSDDYLNLQIGSLGTGITGTSTHSILPSVSNARSDNTVDLGSSGYRWDDVYATNGTIQTSDAREKQDVEELTEAETRVAVAAKALLRKYRWKDAVEAKDNNPESDEVARIHFGIIAQDLKAAFKTEGLDAGRYGMFIHTTWIDEETGEERDRMGIRYSELLAFIIAAI